MSDITDLISETSELVDTVRGFQPVALPIQLAVIETQQQALAQQAEAVQTDLTELLAQLASHASVIEALSVGGEGLTDLCATHATDILALQEQGAAILTHIQSLQTQADTIATHLADLITGPVATLETTQLALSDSQADADGLIVALQTQTTAIIDTLDDLTAALAALEQGTAGSDLATTQAITLLQTQADDLSAQIATITDELTDDDAVMALIQGNVTAAQTQIATILASLGTLATDVTALNGQIFLIQSQQHPVISHGILLTQREITGTKDEMPLYEAVQPANTWVPGDEFRFVLAGRIEGNRGTKEIRIRVNGVELFMAKMSSNTRHPWQASGSVAIRPGNEAVVVFHLDYHEARVLHTTAVIAFDPAIENTLAITGKLSKESDHIFGEMARGETVHHTLL